MYEQFRINYGSWDMKGSHGFLGNSSRIHNTQYSMKDTSVLLLWEISSWF